MFSTESDFTAANKWQALVLRLTGFPIETDSLIVKDWWRHAVGQDPDTKVSRKGGLQIEEQGRAAPGMLSLSVDPLRVSWHLVPVSDAEELFAGAVPSLGPFGDAVEQFRTYVLKWVDVSPALQRLGFGAIVRLPTPDRSAAYRKLDTLLEHVTVDQDSRDFQYRVNRRRASTAGVPGLEINRLATWTCVQWQLKVRVASGGQSREPPASSLQFAAHLELDINTVPEYDKPLPSDRLNLLFDELATLAIEIAARGDIK